MIKEKQIGNADRLFSIVWLIVVVYFVVQPVFHNSAITGLVWKVGIVFLALITISQIRYFEKKDFIVIAILAVTMVVGLASSGEIANIDKWFSIIAFTNLLIFIDKSECITISKKSVDYLYKTAVILTLIFIVYIFAGIANKATTNGRVWTCRYYVFNLDNSNTAGMYLYAIYCLVLMGVFEKKDKKLFNLGLLGALLYMIWRTEARTCIAATFFVTVVGILFKRRKLPKMLEIACFAFPIVFVFGYLWLFYSGFEDIAMGDKTLFSGRQETFVTYLNFIRTPIHVFFGNIGEVTFSNAHNGPLAIFCSTGLIGVVSFYYIFIKKVMKANEYSKSFMNKMAVVGILGFVIQTSGEAGILLGGFPGAPFLCSFFLLALGDFESNEESLMVGDRK